MRAAVLHRGLARSAARSWALAARGGLVLLACLTQFSMPAQSRDTPAIAAQDTASGSGIALANGSKDQSGIHCAVQSGNALDGDGGGPAPCHDGDCPSCPCLCCPAGHVAAGLVPQETVRAVYSPLQSTFVLPPAHPPSHVRRAAFAARPRAPPVLI
ncbi:MAG: hypothetical protein L0Y57_08560 [Beijerinckiaceae bacterium]|nr:hypothetical protein [Beijerinckiaceae bacterium]MCI0736287.1 hypothetical protein [Beijerinckiaceae bacterium]